jgi:hypothetical protein
LHWNVASAWLDSKEKVADDDVVAPIGNDVSAVLGGRFALAVKASSSGAAAAAFATWPPSPSPSSSVRRRS